jgi:hypothetical protein
MTSDEVAKSLVEINRRLCVEVWNLGCEGGIPGSLSPRLVRPKKRDQSDRLSEQEARFLMTGVLGQLNFFYAVETPTKKLYSFTPGGGQISARTDLTLYWPAGQDGELERVANVEFKAGNPVPKDISKDVEKLVKEGLPGNWFHVLDNYDAGTLKSLFGKFEKAFVAQQANFKPGLCILFCVCVLEKKRAWYQTFCPPAGNPAAYITDFFDSSMKGWSEF